MNSFTFFAGTDGLTTITIGSDVSCEIGAKSFIVSNGIFA